MKNEWIRTQIDGLKNGIVPDTSELDRLLNGLTDDEESVLFEEARKIRDRIYGPGIFIRGLIEFTNVCRKGVRTFSWTDYAINPRLRLYSSGLIPPRDNLMRFSLYHLT